MLSGIRFGYIVGFQKEFNLHKKSRTQRQNISTKLSNILKWEEIIPSNLLSHWPIRLYYMTIAMNFAYYKADFENLSCLSVGKFEENHTGMKCEISSSTRY